MLPTFFPNSDGHQEQDFDIALAESTFTFGNILRMDDLADRAITPQPCAARVPILSGIANAIKNELKTESGILAAPNQGFFVMPSRTIARQAAQDTEMVLISLVDHYLPLILTIIPYAIRE